MVAGQPGPHAAPRSTGLGKSVDQNQAWTRSLDLDVQHLVILAPQQTGQPL
jgi:hypothetical protein